VSKTILFLAASPTDQARLRLGAEERDIRGGLKLSKYRDDFNLEIEPATRPKDMLRALMEYKPWIVHFSGHGGGEAGLVLEDDDGFATTVRSLDIPETSSSSRQGKQPVLGEIFQLMRGQVEAVVLNACYTIGK
jgi:hypothetical protein